MILHIEPSVKPSDPLIGNRWEDVAFAVFWAIYTLWGLAASIFGIGTIVRQAGEVYNFLWSGAVGTFSLIACLAAVSLFFKFPGKRLVPPNKKMIEMWAVRVLIPLILVYPVLLMISAIFDGDLNRGVTAVHACSFLVFPWYRQYSLRRRILNFKRATEEIVSDGNN